MSYQTTSHQVTLRFDVEIAYDEHEEKGRRYQGWCRGLAGCWVCASTRAKALRKLREAIGVWLELANQQMKGQEATTSDIIDRMVAG